MSDHSNDSNDKLPNLSELIEEEKREKERQNNILNGKKKQEKRKLLALLVPIGALVVLMGLTLAVYDPFSQNFRWNDSSSSDDSTATGTVSDGDSAAPVAKEWWQAPDRKFPVTVPKWATEQSDGNSVGQEGSSNNAESGAVERFDRSDAQQKLFDAVYVSYEGTGLSNMALTLPSLDGGYTDDVSLRVNEDGSLNTAFTFWSREGFVSEVGVMLNRLLNPVFGGWQTASEQGASDGTKDTLADLFTSAWLGAHSPTELPILTSANSPVAVEYLPTGGTRWVGVVNPESVSMTFTYDKNLKGYVVDYSADVTYSTWTSAKEVSTVTGHLTLKLVPNATGENANSGNRVLISEASLTFP